MRLRTLSIHHRFAGRRPAGRRLLAAVAIAASLLGFAGASRAGVSDYSGTLYLSGSLSSVSGSYRILTASSQSLTTPVASDTGAGSGGPSGSYTWIYTTSSGGVFSASAASNSISPSGTSVSLANVPVGSAVYRQQLGTGAYKLVTASTTVTPYIDSTPNSGLGTTVLPHADNRVASGASCSATTCGYIDFSPGVSPSGTIGNTPPTIVGQPSTPPLPAACKGWIVDGVNSGAVSFASGVWTFGAKVASAGGSTSGMARLAVGLFKVDATGARQGGWLLNPATTEDGSTNLINSAADVTTTASVSGSAPTFAVDSTEHLCVQFYRHQTAPYTSGGYRNRTLSLLAWDPANQISAHPAPNAFANVPTLSAPADGVRVNTIPQLLATYSDPEGEAGTVTFRVCAEAACTPTAPVDSPAQAATNGSTPGWTPSGLGDGTYYWKANAKDPNGLDSAWSTQRSFTLDRSVPTATPTSPANNVLLQSVTLSATYADADLGAGTLDFRVCRDTLCATIVDSTTLAATNGATFNWSPSLGQGVYYWQVRASDGPNTSAWSGTRSFTRDTIAPTTSIGSGRPSNPTNATSASLNFTSDEAGSFTCDLDGASTACSSPQVYSSLAPGSHTFRVHATDPAGNVGGDDTYMWTVDTNPPQTAIGAKPADPTNSTSASVGLSSDEPGSNFECKLDAGSYGTCTAPKSYTGLAAGSHTFYVRATDAAGNTDATPDTYTWTIDLTAPNTTVAPVDPTSPTRATSADFDFSSTETGSTFECSLDSAAFASCTSRKNYTGVGEGPHTFQVRAIDAAGNVDPSPGSFSWTVDLTPPETSIGSGTPADPTSGTSASFTFSASESGSRFECSLDGGSYTSCTSSKSYTGLADGTRTFSVRAIDAAGNVDGTPAAHTWRIDTAPPDTALGPRRPPALLSSSSATFDFTSTESGSTFRCRLDAASFSSCTSPKSYSTLADGSHAFEAQAIDAAGNVDGSPVSYAWTIDTSAPETTLGSSRPAALSNASTASFNFSSTDTGATFECSSDGAAYAACTTPRSLTGIANGSHSFAVRAVDAAGNSDATPASYSWSVDTIAPRPPDTRVPAEEAWRRSTTLSAVFVDPSLGSGAIDFRLCADPLCANVVASGASGVVASGGTADWTPSRKPADGRYFWQARTRDMAGNASPWSSVWALNVDGTPPTAPSHFNGVVAEDGLTLRWDPVSDTVANYVVFVDGAPLVNLGSQTYEIKLGAFDAGDPRRFSVVAVDLAGNVGPASPLLVGVPDVIGLTMTAASDALASRGLHVQQSAALVHAGAETVVAQDPIPATLAEQGSSVQVLIADTIGGTTPLSLAAGPVRSACAAGARIKLRLRLSDRATVSWQLRGVRGGTGRLGSLPAGSSNVRIRLPKGLRTGRTYVLDLRATSGTLSVRTSVKVVGAGTSRVCGAR